MMDDNISEATVEAMEEVAQLEAEVEACETLLAEEGLGEQDCPDIYAALCLCSERLQAAAADLYQAKAALDSAHNASVPKLIIVAGLQAQQALQQFQAAIPAMRAEVLDLDMRCQKLIDQKVDQQNNKELQEKLPTFTKADMKFEKGNLGEGAFGCVRKATVPGLGVRAVKLAEGDEQALVMLRQEAFVLATVTSNHVVEICGVVCDDDRQVIGYIMELAEMDLTTYCSRCCRDGRERLLLALTILQQLGRGLHALHKEGYSHSDVKLANVLVFRGSCGQPVFKLADLGLTTCTDDDGILQCSGYRGTLDYTAPEIWTDSGATTPAVDVFALGIAAGYLVKGLLPPHRADLAACMEHTDPGRDARYGALLEGYAGSGTPICEFKASSESGLPAGVAMLLSAMVNINPLKRPQPLKVANLAGYALDQLAPSDGTAACLRLPEPNCQPAECSPVAAGKEAMSVAAPATPAVPATSIPHPISGHESTACGEFHRISEGRETTDDLVCSRIGPDLRVCAAVIRRASSVAGPETPDLQSTVEARPTPSNDSAAESGFHSISVGSKSVDDQSSALSSSELAAREAHSCCAQRESSSREARMSASVCETAFCEAGAPCLKHDVLPLGTHSVSSHSAAAPSSTELKPTMAAQASSASLESHPISDQGALTAHTSTSERESNTLESHPISIEPEEMADDADWILLKPEALPETHATSIGPERTPGVLPTSVQRELAAWKSHILNFDCEPTALRSHPIELEPESTMSAKSATSARPDLWKRMKRALRAVVPAWVGRRKKVAL